jgi:hypothetical protein
MKTELYSQRTIVPNTRRMSSAPIGKHNSWIYRSYENIGIPLKGKKRLCNCPVYLNVHYSMQVTEIISPSAEYLATLSV